MEQNGEDGMYRESVYADHENPQAYEQAGGMFIYDNLIGASRPMSRDEIGRAHV